MENSFLLTFIATITHLIIDLALVVSFAVYQIRTFSVQQPTGSSASLRGDVEFQFEGDISLYRDPDNSDRINLI